MCENVGMRVSATHKAAQDKRSSAFPHFLVLAADCVEVVEVKKKKKKLRHRVSVMAKLKVFGGERACPGIGGKTLSNYMSLFEDLRKYMCGNNPIN